jgi:UDP-N-acetylglucosamine 2-epimerase (non-hydrolysing)
MIAQQVNLLPQALAHSGVEADFVIDLSDDDHPLLGSVSSAMAPLNTILAKCEPDLVLVQGDTASALAGALAANNQRVPIGHVEAGLRTGDLSAPFPEEINRQLISRVAKFHFAPTEIARNNLLAEGVKEEDIWITGSTVVDELARALDRIENEATASWQESITEDLILRIHDRRRKLVLVTAHRRENLEAGIGSVCRSIAQLAIKNDDWDFVFPVHPNPAVKEPVHSLLGGHSNIFLTLPMSYTEFVFVMSQSSLIITDSGGVQEEAPYLNVPLLVTRNCTERVEGVHAGVAEVVGSEPHRLAQAAERVISTNAQSTSSWSAPGIYGEGKAALHIRDVITSILRDKVKRAMAI